MADAVGAVFGGGFYSLINQWQSFGVFTVLLPLILIFAVVFAILEKINILNNRGVHLVISLAIGFFTVSNPYISSFFMPFFSNLAIGVIIVLALTILIGLAIKPDDDQSIKWIFGITGFVVFIVILAKTGVFKYMFGDNTDIFLAQNSAWVVLFIVLAILVLGVIMGSRGEGNSFMDNLFKKK
jgi:phosphoglycerol transferase MdoB-like AlkP superfamily enzyme